MTFFKLFIALGFLFLHQLGTAQSGFTSGSSNSSSSTGSVTGSYGQLFFYSSEGFKGSVLQGVQQPYSISVSSAMPNTQNVKLKLRTYPNPVVSSLILEIEGYSSNRQIRYVLTDLLGKSLIEGKVTRELTEINTSQLAPATYILRVISENTEQKSFNIIKNR